jgi:predicted type IV restriction endonuclease
MANIPKKVIYRFSQIIGKYQKILKDALNKDVNEADTVVIIIEILSSVFGFDKFEEITSEFAIRHTYCDLAVKVDGKVKFLFEVKAIGISLDKKHINRRLIMEQIRGLIGLF